MAEVKSKRGELIAEESLELVVSLEERPSITLSHKQRYRNMKDGDNDTCENCFRSDESYFKFKFAIRGKDGNIYPFSIELCHEDGDYEIEAYLSLIPSGNHLDFWLEQEIDYNGSKFEKEGCASDKDYAFQLVDPCEGDEEFYPPTECDIKIKMKIYALKDRKEEKRPKLPPFLQSNKANFKITCPTEDGNKEYYVDEKLIAKESDVLETLTSGLWVEGQAKEVNMNDTDCQTVESVLTFCCSKILPMSAIDENLAIFVDKYNMENLMDLIDRVVSMSLSTFKDTKWIVKWTPKLKMMRTALKLVEYLRSEGKNAKVKISKQRKEFASYVYNGYPGLTWAEECKGDKELSSYLGSMIGTKEIFPKYSGLKYSKNVMIMAAKDRDV